MSFDNDTYYGNEGKRESVFQVDCQNLSWNMF